MRTIAVAYCALNPECKLMPTTEPTLWWCRACSSCHSIAGMSPAKNRIVYEEV